MANFKKIGGFGLWKKEGQDGSTYYSGKFKLDQTKLGDSPEVELFFTMSKSEKRTNASPDLWITVKVKGGDDGGQPQRQPPPQEDEDVPF